MKQVTFPNSGSVHVRISRQRVGEPALTLQLLSPHAGKYFYELDEKSARPGYPKLIRDVWGLEGPIDAAFTRVNCEGKTYFFQVRLALPLDLVWGGGGPLSLDTPPTHTHRGKGTLALFLFGLVLIRVVSQREGFRNAEPPDYNSHRLQKQHGA